MILLVQCNLTCRSYVPPPPAAPEEDDFGMSEITIDDAVEKRMPKKLAEAARSGNRVAAMIARKEAQFEEMGVDKNAPSLGNKKAFK